MVKNCVLQEENGRLYKEDGKVVVFEREEAERIVEKQNEHRKVSGLTWYVVEVKFDRE